MIVTSRKDQSVGWNIVENEKDSDLNREEASNCGCDCDSGYGNNVEVSTVIDCDVIL